MTRNLDLWQLISRSLSAGLSHHANKKFFPLFSELFNMQGS
jgi:hypothetical protein